MPELLRAEVCCGNSLKIKELVIIYERPFGGQDSYKYVYCYKYAHKYVRIKPEESRQQLGVNIVLFDFVSEDSLGKP